MDSCASISTDNEYDLFVDCTDFEKKYLIIRNLVILNCVHCSDASILNTVDVRNGITKYFFLQFHNFIAKILEYKKCLEKKKLYKISRAHCLLTGQKWWRNM